jgi:hypothetical protein
MYTQRSSSTTIRQKMLAGYNLVWNSKSSEVHSTGARCHSSDHLDRMALEHEHFFVGYYTWDGTKWQLYLVRWDPETAGPANISYSNCAFCKPETTARQ